MRGARRFREQKWLIDAAISTIGLDFDQLRMAPSLSTRMAPLPVDAVPCRRT